jgi:hypothetical protein
MCILLSFSVLERPFLPLLVFIGAEISKKTPRASKIFDVFLCLRRGEPAAERNHGIVHRRYRPEKLSIQYSLRFVAIDVAANGIWKDRLAVVYCAGDQPATTVIGSADSIHEFRD